MWVLQRKPVGAMDGSKNIIMMMSMEDNLTTIKLKNWVSRTVRWCLGERVGGKQVHLGKPAPIRDIFCWKRKRTVVHWGLLLYGGKCEP